MRRFREEHPYHRARIGDVEWQYVSAGTGARTLLLLPGALSTAESSWQTIAWFGEGDRADRFRVLAPSYPPSIATMTALVDGIARLLEEERLSRATVFGGSYGGFVAQAFVERHADRTEGLVLSHTTPSDTARGLRIAASLRWLRILPTAVLRLILKQTLSRLLPKDNPETALLAAHMTEVIDEQLTREAIFNGYRRVVDFDTHFPPEAGRRAAWSGPVLLMMADDDPATPATVREALRTRYPQAIEHLFQGTGHLAAILKREEYCAAVEAFVGQERPGNGAESATMNDH